MITLTERTTALADAARLGTDRLPPGLIGDATGVVHRAEQRTALSAEHTVVALAGATGSGKSSVFNALVGQPIATPGVQRPTTSHAMAAIWPVPAPGQDAGPLLDWLEVPRRHEIPANPSAAPSKAQPSSAQPSDALLAATIPGLVLLDLPDHDSVVTDHRIRAERLVERADLLVWVVDPQKYADAAIHERYLRPLAGHAGVVVLVLNQVDRLTPADAAACLGDLRRLAALDGLADARVLAVSARTGQGIDDLRQLLTEAATRRKAANDRLVADERAVATRILDACGAPLSERGSARARESLVDALQSAAGVATVVAAVRAASMRDARAATGWPVTRWAGALRADPLRRLGLRRTEITKTATKVLESAGMAPAAERPDLARTSLPTPPAAIRAGAQTAVRDYLRTVTVGLPDAWALAARERVQEGSSDLPAVLDRAIATTPLGIDRKPWWWRVVGAVQWLAVAALAGGLLWLGVLFVLGYLQMPPPGTPTWRRLPVPTLMVIGGIVVGVVLALVSRGFAAVGAKRRAARARRRLRESIGQAADQMVCIPAGEELDALRRCRAAAAIAAS